MYVCVCVCVGGGGGVILVKTCTEYSTFCKTGISINDCPGIFAIKTYTRTHREIKRTICLCEKSGCHIPRW